MKPARLYNTLSRTVEDIGLQEQSLKIYTCGPTVYDYQHIGNYRTFIFEDVLVKTLRFLGYSVDRVMNITDVGHLTSDADEGEDKLEAGARREGSTAWDIAKKYEAAFLEDLQKLQIEKPEKLVRATDTIEQQINLIKDLEAKGYTYTTDDGVYFDSEKFPTYGTLARLNPEGQQAGARVEMNQKKHATDFALWKFSPRGTKRDMEWESPWGTGFPGWHLECSAIIRTTLGDTIDIHCGGVDHIPVHHTNEIAQSEAATGKPLSRIWSHSEFLLIDGGKMSKSLGNVYTLADLEKRGYDPLAFRLLTYSASYRSKLNFTWESLDAAAQSLDRLRSVYQETTEENRSEAVEEYLDKVASALADDLNLPVVMAIIWDALRSSHTSAEKRALLTAVEPVLSLNLNTPLQEAAITPEVQELLEQRETARQQKDWLQSDELRSHILSLGYEVLDTENGQVIKKKK